MKNYARGKRNSQYRHGMDGTKTYRAWGRMLERCRDPRRKYHAGRGITVCKRWHDFVNFYADMGDRPDGMTMERIDNDGNYEPDNCKWATHAEQSRNTRYNHLVTFQGKTQCVTDWAEELGINRITLYSRLRKGWSVEKALTTLVRTKAPDCG